MTVKKSTIIKIAAAAILALIVTAAAILPGLNKEGGASGYVYKGAKMVAAGSASDKYSLSMDSESLAVTVTNKLTGEIVLESGNILSDSEDYDNGLNNTWEAFARSAVIVYYTNERLYKPLTEFKRTVNITETETGFAADIYISDIKLSFKLVASLKDGMLDISVPYESITEENPDKTPLVRLAIYPFMNATRGISAAGTKESFMLLPDGSGAVADLKQPTHAGNIYEGRIYGEDLALAGVAALKKYGITNPPQNVSFPGFGLADSGKGFIAHIGEGAEYSLIKAYKSGIVTDYNFVFNTFIYRDSYSKPYNNRGDAITYYQQDKNVFDAKVRYMILEDEAASLGGMAEKYRDNLRRNGSLKSGGAVTGNIPVKIDYLMADSYSDTFGRSKVIMSDTAFVQESLKELAAAGVKNISAGIKGFTDGGLSGSAPRHFGFESASGSAADYKKLALYAADSGIGLMLITEFIKADKNLGNFSKNDVAMTYGNQFITFPDYNKSRTANMSYDDYYMLHPKATAKYFSEDLNKLKSNGFDAVQIDTIGAYLASGRYNYNSTRTQSAALYRQMLSDTGVKTILENPSEYLWDKTNAAVNTPTGGSGFMIAPKSVPFLQMLTSGAFYSYTPYYNLAGAGVSELLKMAEYGVYPSFIITKESSEKLLHTNSEYIYSSKYEDWKDEIIRVYKLLDAELSMVRGAEFTARTEISDGVVLCGYSNGVTIAVNYSGNDFIFNGTVIAAKSFKAVEA